jgi:hypothetical protein
MAQPSRCLAAAVTPAAAHVCYNHPKEVPLDYLKLLMLGWVLE